MPSRGNAAKAILISLKVDDTTTQFGKIIAKGA